MTGRMSGVIEKDPGRPIGWPRRRHSIGSIAESVLVPLLIGFVGGGCGTDEVERTSTAPGASGVTGIVLRGPTCPVEQEGVSCPPSPIAAKIEIRGDNGAVTTVHSSADGSFRVALAPGTYAFQAVPEGFGSSKPVNATVVQGTFTDVVVTIDTGMRGSAP